MRVAVVWTRDGRAFSLESGRAAIQPKAGLIPVDVAAYQDGPQVRFAAVWVKPNANEKAGFYAGVPAEQHRAAFADFQKADFEPLTLHALHDASGVVRYSGVWGNSAPKNALATWDNDDDSHRGRILLADKLAVDVGLNVSAKPVLGVDYWKQQRAGAEAQLATNADDLTARYNRGRALFRLGEEALADFDAVLAGDKPPVPAFRYRAQLHARAGRSDAARRDLAEFVKRTTSALNRQCVTALVAFERGDDAAGMTALDAARQAATDTAAADLASAYAFCASAAARWQTLDVAGLVGAPTALTPFLVRPLDRVKQLLDRAETHFTQALRTRSFTDFDLSADLSVLAGRAVYDKVLAERAKPKDHAVSVWHVDAKREAEQTYGMSVGANLERCRELAAEGYRPAALAVAVLTEGKTTTASVWQRPAPERLAREQLARRQATGAATMLQLEPAEEAWALFRQRPDSEARSQLIWRGQLLGLKASQLMRRLEEEKDVSAKRALVLALGEYDAEQLPENERRPLVAKLIQLYKDDPDPGLHGAIDWLLRHAKEGPADRRLNWGQAQALESIDKELQRRDTTGASPVALAPGGTTRGWYVNGQGQTMIKVVGPVEFRMGSPPSDLEQVANNERPHRRRIPRNFAMGARSVTIAEFERFLKEKPDAQHSYAKNYSPEATGPIIAVTWFQAAQYCNWLSEKEGLPETEWCYPKHEDIKEEMTLPKDHLKRKGYRLPTEAEWEFAARSGAASNRCYGSSLELLPRYA